MVLTQNQVKRPSYCHKGGSKSPAGLGGGGKRVWDPDLLPSDRKEKAGDFSQAGKKVRRPSRRIKASEKGEKRQKR